MPVSTTVVHRNRFTGYDMDVCYGLKVHRDVWIAPNKEIKGKWMQTHHWTRQIVDVEKFNSAESAQAYADGYGLLGCKPAVIPPSNLPTAPEGGTPVAVAA